MKVTIVQIVIGAFGTVTKGLLKGPVDLEVGGRVETIQTTVLFWTAREESWRLEETCCHSNSSEKPSTDADVKNSKRGFNNNNNPKLRTEQFYLTHKWDPGMFYHFGSEWTGD